ncbi:GntR family transcriptional regulator [Palleronia sp. KMU-117]|uniref:GntR family transcriptional regulator n=1 Tax=Palleronia sp. KMU-117 TaxID=3434108 RepID=UPI003D73C7D2
MDDRLTVKRAAAPIREQVLQNLRTEIIEGRLAPGRRLTERELTEMLGVSRTVLRESLRQLESEGLISLIPNKGPVVRALTVEEARELYRIRETLEGLGARLFAERPDPAHLALLEDAFAEVERAYRGGDPRTILLAKNAFYDAIHTGAGSNTLSKMLSTVLAQIWRWRAVGLAHPRRSAGRSSESVAKLREVVEAIKSGNGDRAEQAARTEARLAAAEVLRILDEVESKGKDALPDLQAIQA